MSRTADRPVTRARDTGRAMKKRRLKLVAAYREDGNCGRPRTGACETGIILWCGRLAARARSDAGPRGLVTDSCRALEGVASGSDGSEEGQRPPCHGGQQ